MYKNTNINSNIKNKRSRNQYNNIKTMDYHQNRLKPQVIPIRSHLDRDELENRTRFKLFMSEFLGTFIFVYLAQSTITSLELIGTQNDTINRQLAITLTYGLAFLLATLLTLNLSGAHLNPAYTLASALYSYLKWGRAFNYICAQYLGSFLAAIFLHATYSDKLAQRHSEGLLTGMNATFKAHGNILSTGKLFSSYPPTEVSLVQLSISYTLASILLMLILLAIQESKLIKLPNHTKPIYMAAALVLTQAAFAANGGPVINPAQDFSPRLYIAIFGWGSSAFNLYHYQYWWICGIVAPHLGAVIGFGLYQILSHINTIQERMHTISDGHEYTLPKDDNDY